MNSHPQSPAERTGPQPPSASSLASPAPAGPPSAAAGPKTSPPPPSGIDDSTPQRAPTGTPPRPAAFWVEDFARTNISLVVDQYNCVYAVERGLGNPVVMGLDSSALIAKLRHQQALRGQRLSKKQLHDLLEEIRAEGEASAERATVWRRIGLHPTSGIVVAMYDEANTQVHIDAGKVEVIRKGSDVLFCRPLVAEAMTMPSETGDYKLLHKYLNLDAVSFTLYIAWLTYTLAHPKVPASNYLILVFIGAQGTGKSHASKVTIRLVDPSKVGVERLPNNVKDLAVATQNAHLKAYDNIRAIPPAMSDNLCVVATGGSVSYRKLYTDEGQHVLQLHAALLLNGIYSFVDQPDLAQRCLPIRLNPIAEARRQSDAELFKNMEADLPVIQRGLFDLIAAVLTHLPNAKVTHPERMIDFVKWLAAMEMAHGIPAGIYQSAYSELLNDGQLDSLLDNSLGAAVLKFMDELQETEWSGQPHELLSQLNLMMAHGIQRPPRDWPSNEIALSKRLATLQAPLTTQGIRVEFKRGKLRTVTLQKIGGAQ